MSTATPADPQDHQGVPARVVLLAAAIGIPAALVAAGFFVLVHYLEHWLWDDLRTCSGTSPRPGSSSSGSRSWVRSPFLPGDGGHCRSRVERSPLPSRMVPASRSPRSARCPSGPCSARGAGRRSGLRGRRWPPGSAPTQTAALLSSAGSFSAISTLFGGPVVAGVLLVESAAGFGLGPGSSRPRPRPGRRRGRFPRLHRFGDWEDSRRRPRRSRLPLYDGVDFGDLGVGLVVGVLAAFVAVSVGLLARRVDGAGGRLGTPLLLVGGGLAVGGHRARRPFRRGLAGRPLLRAGVRAGRRGGGLDEGLVVLIIAKFLAYGASLGCGFRGGYMPRDLHRRVRIVHGRLVRRRRRWRSRSGRPRA